MNTYTKTDKRAELLEAILNTGGTDKEAIEAVNAVFSATGHKLVDYEAYKEWLKHGGE